ncbi:MAG: hypothetical protein D6798_13935 [Deltaproteobacteria bacterium]|nr:MAG: hypothetical protein D6798_13935 [Deltaproteobacteria bacterium]
MPELMLHKSLYDAAVVHQVARLYEGVATIAVDEDPHAVTVRFDDVDPDVADVLVDHFGNHVLVETVKQANAAEQVLMGDSR